MRRTRRARGTEGFVGAVAPLVLLVLALLGVAQAPGPRTAGDRSTDELPSPPVAEEPAAGEPPEHGGAADATTDGQPHDQPSSPATGPAALVGDAPPEASGTADDARAYWAEGGAPEEFPQAAGAQEPPSPPPPPAEDDVAPAGDEHGVLMDEIEVLRGRLEHLEERENILEQMEALQNQLASLDSGKKKAPPAAEEAETPAVGEEAGLSATDEAAVETAEMAGGAEVGGSPPGGSSPSDEEEDDWIEGTEAKTQLEEIAAQEAAVKEAEEAEAASASEAEAEAEAAEASEVAEAAEAEANAEAELETPAEAAAAVETQQEEVAEEVAEKPPAGEGAPTGPEPEPEPEPAGTAEQPEADKLKAASEVANADAAVSPAVRYKAISKGVIREGADKKSPKVGDLVEGTIIEVLATETVAGIERVQFDQGWTSVTAGSGKLLLELLAAEEPEPADVPAEEATAAEAVASTADKMEPEPEPEFEPDAEAVVQAEANVEGAADPDSVVYDKLCEGVSCGDHGACAAGECVCADSFKGAHCDEEPASQAVLEHLGLGSKDKVADKDQVYVPLEQKVEEAADAKPEEDVAEYESAAEVPASEGSLDERATQVDGAAVAAEEDRAAGESNTPPADSTEQSEPPEDDSGVNTESAGDEESSTGSDVEAPGETGDSPAATAVAAEVVDSGEGDGSAEEEHPHDDDDWIEGTEAKTQLEEIKAAEEAARAQEEEEEELARKQQEELVAAEQEKEQAAQAAQAEATDSDAAEEAEDAATEPLANGDPVTEMVAGDVKDDREEVPQADATEEDDGKGIMEADVAADDRHTADCATPPATKDVDAVAGAETSASAAADENLSDDDTKEAVVEKAPEEELDADDTADDTVSEGAKLRLDEPQKAFGMLNILGLAASESGDLENATELEERASTLVQAAPVSEPLKAASEDVQQDVSEEISVVTAATTDEVKAEAVADSQPAPDVGASQPSGGNAGPAAVSEEVASTSTSTSTPPAAGDVVAPIDAASSLQNAENATEEERLERLRAEKKALQEQLERSKKDKKDAKAKPAGNETAAADQPPSPPVAVKPDPALIATDANPAPPSLEKKEPAKTAYKDTPSSQEPAASKPMPKEDAGSVPGSKKEKKDKVKPAANETAENPADELSNETEWDMERAWETAEKTIEVWSNWWGRFFVDTEHQSFEGDVKWTSGEDARSAERKELDDRFNYAGFDVGARVLQAHKKTKGARNTLMWDVDQYMSTPCSLKKKWVVLQLSEPLIVEKIMIANFEQYASTFRHFQVLGSPTYPVNVPGGPGGWKLLGSFVAKDHNNAQDFVLKSPQHAKYLKVRFLSQYGQEHHCTVSSIKVFGENMLENMLRLEKEDADKHAKSEAKSEEKAKQLALEAATKDEKKEEGSTGAVAQVGDGKAVGIGQAAVGDGKGSTGGDSDTSQQGGEPSKVATYDLNKISAAQNRMDHSKCLVVPWNDAGPDQMMMTPAPECFHSTMVAAPYSVELLDAAAAKAAAADSSAAHASAQAALAGAQAAADADENPFRAMTNKIRVLELNHSATVLMVDRLEAQNTVVMSEVQRTQDTRDEAVVAVETLLAEHSTKVEAAHREMRKIVQDDAKEIFGRVQAAVTSELAQNFSSTLSAQDEKHALSLSAMQQRLEFYATAAILALVLALGQCVVTAFSPLGRKGFSASLAGFEEASPRGRTRLDRTMSMESWSSSEEELGGVPPTWAQRRRRWRRRRPSDPDRAVSAATLLLFVHLLTCWRG